MFGASSDHAKMPDFNRSNPEEAKIQLFVPTIDYMTGKETTITLETT